MNTRLVHTLIACVLTLSLASEAWARPPRSRVTTVRVESIDPASRELTVRHEGKTLTLKWSNDTRFMSCSGSIGSDAIYSGMDITITYRAPAFGKRLLKRVDLCDSQRRSQ